jgi:hypothetical protein
VLIFVLYIFKVSTQCLYLVDLKLSNSNSNINKNNNYGNRNKIERELIDEIALDRMELEDSNDNDLIGLLSNKNNYDNKINNQNSNYEPEYNGEEEDEKKLNKRSFHLKSKIFSFSFRYETKFNKIKHGLRFLMEIFYFYFNKTKRC